MPQRLPARIDVDNFCTVHRRTLLRGLGSAALLTATGGLFRGGAWASPVFVSSPFALGVAYGDPAPERFDFVFPYGDYIYEYRVVRPGERLLPVIRVMPGEPDESYTLDDYRQRYALYKSDADLQTAHAAAPFIMSYDDHEVDNNWAGDISEENTPPELFLLRRAAAFQTWYEHMPVRRALMPRG